jgi:monoterpene epsilon-lactone hydrolase
MKLAEHPNRYIALAFGGCIAVIVTAILAQPVPASGADLAPLVIGPRTLPVPTGEVSPEMQAVIAVKPRTSLLPLVKTGEETRVLADKYAAVAIKSIPDLLTRLNLTMTAATIDGVRVHIITPETIPAENRRRVLLHFHGGCYVLAPGAAGTIEGILMAALGHYKVISVDYRMPPEAYFPAALDDSVTVYRNVIKTTPPKRVAVFGLSAGGALTLEMMLKARELNLPLPAAIGVGTPMADATKVGDSFYTNEGVDNLQVSRNGFCDAATVVYAHGHDLKDPLISPIYGDMHGFPPAILTTGTRDLLLSNTVRTHRKLRRSGVEADLNVYEGQSHAHWARDVSIPETREAFGEIATFFDKHMAK